MFGFAGFVIMCGLSTEYRRLYWWLWVPADLMREYSMGENSSSLAFGSVRNSHLGKLTLNWSATWGQTGCAQKSSPRPESTPCGRTEIDNFLCLPKVPKNQRKRPKAAIQLSGWSFCCRLISGSDKTIHADRAGKGPDYWVLQELAQILEVPALILQKRSLHMPSGQRGTHEDF